MNLALAIIVWVAFAAALGFAGWRIYLLATNRESGEEVELLAMLDANPTYQALDADGKVDVLRQCVRLLHLRQRIRTLRVLVWSVIISVVVVLALWGEQSLNARQNHETRARAAAIQAETDARVAAQAHTDRLARYELCVTIDTKIVNPLRNSIAKLTPPVPAPAPGSDPATIARIVQTNMQRAAARAILDEGLVNLRCGPKP